MTLLQQTRKGERSMAELWTYARTELTHRSSDGADVMLVWVHDDHGDKVVVCVCDKRERAYFEIPAEPYLTLDVYYHPFAYRDFSNVGSRRVAASPRRSKSVPPHATQNSRRGLSPPPVSPSVIAADDADGLPVRPHRRRASSRRRSGRRRRREVLSERPHEDPKEQR
jgi:hypothetical protein